MDESGTNTWVVVGPDGQFMDRLYQSEVSALADIEKNKWPGPGITVRRVTVTLDEVVGTVSTAQVTVAQYQAFLTAQLGIKVPSFWDEQLKCPHLPVVGMTALDADAYCAWKGCRLPTEEELDVAFCAGVFRLLPALWEWTSTVEGASKRVLRGGSWDYDPGHLRASFCVGVDPTYRNGYYGFRCARK